MHITHGGVQKRLRIRGYHIYKEIWWAAIGEELECDTEPDNLCDRYSEEST